MKFVGDNLITTGRLTKLQSGKQDVDSVEKDSEAGLMFEGKPVIEVGDILSFYIEERSMEKFKFKLSD